MPVVATSADPFVGRSFGNVRLTGRLGAGAMGVVYRGYHERFDREVAVKLLVGKREDKPSYRERFLREGKSAAKVRHEHVVQVLDAGQEGDIAYLVMELVNGLSLGSILEEAKVLAPDVVQKLGVGIALGLAAIHDKGIIHRDIKPDNILVGGDKKAKIADLGLAKQLDEPEMNRLTQTGVVVGTPLYVAPEAIRDPQKIDGKADVYGLGATLYHMLTGKPPFDGQTPFEVMHGHLDGRVVPIRQLRPEVPAPLAALVEECLAKKPEARPTAMELADLLTQGGRVRTPSKLPLVIAGVALLGVLGGGAAWWVGRTGASTVVTDPLAPPPPAEAGTLALRAPAGEVRVQVDGGPWRPLPADGLALAAGPRALVVEAAGDGPLLRATIQAAVARGERREIAPAFAPVAVPAQVRVPVPGKGMIYWDGAAYSLIDSTLTLRTAGRWAIARWDGGATWQNAEVVIAADGTASAPQWQPGALPARTAFWRVRDEQGAPLPAHHLVCWWEAELARKASNLPEGVNWQAGVRTPHEKPEHGLDVALVQACVQRFAAIGARLPDAEQARQLMTALRTPMWCLDGTAINAVTIGGLTGKPQLVLVPGEP